MGSQYKSVWVTLLKALIFQELLKIMRITQLLWRLSTKYCTSFPYPWKALQVNVEIVLSCCISWKVNFWLAIAYCVLRKQSSDCWIIKTTTSKSLLCCPFCLKHLSNATALGHFTLYSSIYTELSTILVIAGDILVFDNQRIMHARLPFDPTYPRRLEGWYISWDMLHSQLRLCKIKKAMKGGDN